MIRRLSYLAGGLAALVLAFAGGHWTGDRSGRASERSAHAAATLEAERANAAETRRLIAQIDQLAQENIHAQARIQADAAAASGSVKRLLATIRDADARADPGATCGADAATARAQLAQCAERYRDVAERADSLRATVIGLQAYAREVTTRAEE